MSYKYLFEQIQTHNGNFNNKIFLIVIFILLETRKVAMESNKFEGEIFLKDGVGGRGAVGEVLKHTL